MSDSEDEVFTDNEDQITQETQTQEDLTAAINALVRFVVMTQPNTVIKNEDINKKIIAKYLPKSNSKKTFTSAKILSGANRKLRKLFAMELVDLKAEGTKGPKTYTKVTILEPPERFMSLVNSLPDPALPSRALLTLTICLIYVNEMSILQEELFRLLTKVGVEPNLYIRDLTPNLLQAPNKGSMEHLLAAWVKEGYIVKNIEKGVINNKSISYSLGGRTLCEFPARNIKLFMVEFYPELSALAKQSLATEITRCSGKVKKKKQTDEAGASQSQRG